MTVTASMIRPCLGFDDQAEEAVDLCTGAFPDLRVLRTTHFGREGHEIHGRPEGAVMTIDFELGGSTFTALNGGRLFTFTEAVSRQVRFRDQKPVDHSWERLREGGDESARQFGWLKDRFGLSWQIIHEAILTLLGAPDDERSRWSMAAMLSRKKPDPTTIRAAWEGLSRIRHNASMAPGRA